MSVPVKFSLETPDVIRRLREKGWSWESVAKAIGVCRSPTLMRYVTAELPDIYRGHLSRGAHRGPKVKALGLQRMKHQSQSQPQMKGRTLDAQGDNQGERERECEGDSARDREEASPQRFQRRSA